MNDDRSGIDQLRLAIAEVAATLEPSGARQRRGRLARSAAALISLGLIAAAGWWIARDTGSPGSSLAPPPAERLGVEVKLLRLQGRDVDPRVFDAAGAGTIVVVPRQRGLAQPGPAVFLLQGGK